MNCSVPQVMVIKEVICFQSVMKDYIIATMPFSLESLPHDHQVIYNTYNCFSWLWDNLQTQSCTKPQVHACMAALLGCCKQHKINQKEAPDLDHWSWGWLWQDGCTDQRKPRTHFGLEYVLWSCSWGRRVALQAKPARVYLWWIKITCAGSIIQCHN